MSLTLKMPLRWKHTTLKDRQSIPEGEFGSMGDYYCEQCGVYVYGDECPNWPHELNRVDISTPFKATKRYRLFPYRGHCQHGIDWRERCDDCWAMVPTED